MKDRYSVSVLVWSPWLCPSVFRSNLTTDPGRIKSLRLDGAFYLGKSQQCDSTKMSGWIWSQDNLAEQAARVPGNTGPKLSSLEGLRAADYSAILVGF